MVCKDIQQQLDELVCKRNSLQKALKTALSEGQVTLVTQIKMLDEQITIKRHELDICLIQNPSPESLPFCADFSGTFTVSIFHPSVAKPIAGVFSSIVCFDSQRTIVSLISLSISVVAFETPVGKNTTSVTLIGSGRGSFDKPTGQMSLMLPLFLEHCLNIPSYDEVCHLNILLGTGRTGSLVGSPLDATGSITLIGSALMSGGYLGGSRTDLSISGRVSIVP